MAGFLALLSAPAQAAVRHQFLSRITEVPAEGPKGESVPLPGPLEGPGAMTVDSGRLYVAESHGAEGNRLDTFDASSGAFALQFPQVPSLSFLQQGVAVAHATGEVYRGGDEFVEGVPHGVVGVFSAAGSLQSVWSGAATSQGSFGCFECNGAGDVAVDNNPSSLSDWAAGDVFVAAPLKGIVDVFKPGAGGTEETKPVQQIEGPKAPCTAGQPECLNPLTREPCKAEETGCLLLFIAPTAVAVDDANGNVLVVDSAVIDVFRPTVLNEYEFVRQISGTPSGPFPSGAITAMAIGGGEGNGDIYVATGGVVDQFTSEGVYLGHLTGVSPSEPFAGLRSVAVDPATGHVFVGEAGAVDVFAANLVLPDVTTLSPSELTPVSATLRGTVNPDGAGEASCEFEYGTSTSYGQHVGCEKNVLNGNAPVEVGSLLVTGLLPDTTYHYRLDATNVNGTNTGECQTADCGEFTTPGPGIHSESASNVAATSATLHATIDPHNLPTSYYFQYSTTSTTSCETTPFSSSCPSQLPPPGEAIDSAEGDVQLEQHVQGLSAGTAYHYRVVAVSEPKSGIFEAFEGPDQTFTTQTAGGFSLPDVRAWEMVSPPDKHGALIESIQEADVIQAATSGDAMTYVTTATTETEAQGYSNLVQVLATRGPRGWQSRDIAVPHSKATSLAIGGGQEYRAFSNDLSLGVVTPFGQFDPLLSPEASEQTAYLRADYLHGDVNETCTPTTMHCYRPLVTSAPGYEDVPPGTPPFGHESDCGSKPICGPDFVGASADLSHVVLTSDVALTGTPVPPGESLYEWSSGHLALISALPESAGPASGPKLGYQGASVHNAISADGTRVVWEAEHHLYMSEPEKERTIQLDVIQGGEGGHEDHPVFQFASSDGSKIYFTDNQRLTKDSGALDGAEQRDLYECEMIEENGKLKCKLVDLTPSSPRGESARVQGAVLGASEDGSYVYFVAQGILAEGASPGNCEESGSVSVGTCNLYVYHAGRTKLVATPAGEDSPDWAKGFSEHPNVLTARVSPNGQWLAFMSQRSLTGYNNEDITSKKPGERMDEEVFLYHAATGGLVCASCNPTGARPVGTEYENIDEKLVGGKQVWLNQVWLAANIPGWTPYRLGSSLYQSRYLSDSGRLFFNSDDALVSQDVNGTWDVYQYEPPLVGSCSTASVTYRERSRGCVGLISSGSSPEESAFLDASATGGRDPEGHEGGGDVFFLTAEKLVSQDFDTGLDVYDAHECMSSAPCFPTPAAQPPPCTTEASCKVAPSPQPGIFGAPPSATFSGPGNLVPQAPGKPKTAAQIRAEQLAKALRACRKKHGKKRATCERHTKQRYSPKPKKASHQRRAK
ncbi:MAG TPA: hypothetical protein VGG98_08115 [Solirubrobacteraceae bacterium]